MLTAYKLSEGTLQENFRAKVVRIGAKRYIHLWKENNTREASLIIGILVINTRQESFLIIISNEKRNIYWYHNPLLWTGWSGSASSFKLPYLISLLLNPTLVRAGGRTNGSKDWASKWVSPCFSRHGPFRSMERASEATAQRGELPECSPTKCDRYSTRQPGKTGFNTPLLPNSSYSIVFKKNSMSYWF